VLRAGVIPAEVITDRAPAYPRVLDELIPSALHTVEQYANNPVEADHGRLKARLVPAHAPSAREYLCCLPELCLDWSLLSHRNR